MPVGMLISGEGVTRETYQKLTEAMFGNYPMTKEQSPDGLIVHTAGDSEQGYYVYDIWESKEHFQRFAEGQLRPAGHELGLQREIQPMFFDIEVMVEGRSR
jgi:heme-degrading monooxygenase HmoA